MAEIRLKIRRHRYDRVVSKTLRQEFASLEAAFVEDTSGTLWWILSAVRRKQFPRPFVERELCQWLERHDNCVGPSLRWCRPVLDDPLDPHARYLAPVIWNKAFERLNLRIEAMNLDTAGAILDELGALLLPLRFSPESLAEKIMTLCKSDELLKTSVYRWASSQRDGNGKGQLASALLERF